MTRFLCAFVAVLSAVIAGFAYLQVFADEFGHQSVHSIKDFYSPMGRHFLGFIIVVTATWPTVALVSYRLFGKVREVNVLREACRRLSPFYMGGGALMIGLSQGVIFGQPIQWRDLVIASVGVGIIAMAIFARATYRPGPPSNGT